jgi:O-antigen/teichoic acid export membrane protein
VDLFNIESDLKEKAQVIAYLTAIGALTSWPLRGFATAIMGLQRYDINALILFSGRIVNAGATIVLLLSGYGIIDLVFWGIVIGAFTQLAIAIVVQRLMPFLTLKREYMEISTLKSIFKFSSVVFIGQIVGLIVLGTDRIVIGAFVSVGAITFYAVARNIHDLVRTSSQLSESALLPAASELDALDKKGQLEQLVTRGSKYKSALIICTSITAIMLAEPLIRHWMGSDFLNMVLPTQVYISYWLLFAAWGVMGTVLLAKEKYRPILYFSVSIAISNLVLSLILVQFYGVLGVIMGTTIPYFVIFPVLVPYGLHLLDINYWRYLKNSLLISYIIGGVTALLFYFILFLYTPNSLLEVVIFGVIGFCIYFGIFYAIGLTPKERNDVKAFFK